MMVMMLERVRDDVDLNYKALYACLGSFWPFVPNKITLPSLDHISQSDQKALAVIMDANNPNKKIRSTPEFAQYQRQNFWADNEGKVPPFNTREYKDMAPTPAHGEMVLKQDIKKKTRTNSSNEQKKNSQREAGTTLRPMQATRPPTSPTANPSTVTESFLACW
jgi:hypothetical protein